MGTLSITFGSSADDLTRADRFLARKSLQMKFLLDLFLLHRMKKKKKKRNTFQQPRNSKPLIQFTKTLCTYGDF